MRNARIAEIAEIDCASLPGVERFHKTVHGEFYRVAFRKKIYDCIAELRRRQAHEEGRAAKIMKILLVAKPWRGGLADHFYSALQEMFPGGVRWLSTRPRTLSDHLEFRRDRRLWWDRFRREIDATDCDAAFFIGSRPEFRGVKAHPRNVLYQTDDVRMRADDLEPFSRIFISDPGYRSELVKLLRPSQSWGVLPFACHPAVHYPIANAERRRGVYLVANRDPKRDAYVDQLLGSGLTVRVIGNYFGKHPLFYRRPSAFRPPVLYTQLSRVYAECQVSVNVHAGVVREGTNQHSFQAAACGVAQVVERLPGIEDYFEPEKEMTLFRDPEEMVAQLRAALSDHEASAKIAGRARRRALSEHTYYHRIAAAFAHLAPRAKLETAVRAVVPAHFESVD
jgi:spore maturation protein CgeB